MTKTVRGSQGMVMALALVLLAMVSVALLIVTQLVRDDARRTFHETQDAQLRSYVLAAIVDARTHLQRENTLAASSTLSLPGTVGDASLRYKSVLVDGNWRLRIDSIANDRELHCDCVFKLESGKWSLAKSVMEPATMCRMPAQATTRAAD